MSDWGKGSEKIAGIITNVRLPGVFPGPFLLIFFKVTIVVTAQWPV